MRSLDSEGEASTWSDTACFEIGLLERDDWKAQWIASPLEGAPKTPAPVPALRREFEVDRPVARARLYVTALGLYDVEINGRRVGDHELAPGWTDYRVRVRYQVHDITEHVQQGANAIGALLGDGWYCGFIGLVKVRESYGSRPALLAQLEIFHEDGSETRIVSDGQWSWHASHILESDIMQGETVDARRDLGGWTRPGYTEEGWRPVDVASGPSISLDAMSGPPVRSMRELSPVGPPRRDTSVQFPARWIFDLGQNMVGRVRLRVRGEGAAPCSCATPRCSSPNGTLYTENLRDARATDTFTLSGTGQMETFEPRFTFHGFRYVEVSGALRPDAIEEVTGIVLHSDMEETGRFACSDDDFEPALLQRRLGPARQLRRCADGLPAARRAARLDGRRPGLRQDRGSQHGRGRVLREVAARPRGQPGRERAHSARRACAPRELSGGLGWRAGLGRRGRHLPLDDPPLLRGPAAPGGALRRHGCVPRLPPRQRFPNCIRSDPAIDPWGGFGDWVALDGTLRHESRIGSTPKELIGTAFLAHSAKLLADVAHVIHRSEEERYRELAARAREAFRRRFVTPDGLVAGNTQTSYVLALHFELLEPHERELTGAALVRNVEQHGHLTTGFVGTPYLLRVLTQLGRLDLAYRLLLRREFPSWLYPVVKGDATTIWERWDGWTEERGFFDPEMNSFNHYAYGSVAEWLYATVAGLDLDPHPNARGWRRARLAPRPPIHPGLPEEPLLESASAWLQTVSGRYEVGWVIEADRFRFEARIPPGATARVELPDSSQHDIAAGPHRFDLALTAIRQAANGSSGDGP